MKNNMRLLLAKQRKKTADVAEATGISKSTLTALYYERAKSPTLDTLKKVSSYLGVTIDEFLDVKEQKGESQLQYQFIFTNFLYGALPLEIDKRNQLIIYQIILLATYGSIKGLQGFIFSDFTLL